MPSSKYAGDWLPGMEVSVEAKGARTYSGTVRTYAVASLILDTEEGVVLIPWGQIVVVREVRS